MARSRNNIIVRNFTGIIGPSHYVMKRGNEELIIRRPNRKGHIKTPNEKRNQGKFAQAQRYASAVTKDPERRAFYTPFRKDSKLEYHLAIGDYLLAPEIQEFNIRGYKGRAGDCIEVVAYDNIKVTAASCRIYGVGGEILEEGPASLDPVTGYQWQYRVQFDHLVEPGVKILFSVFDFAGNETKKVLE